MKTPKVFPQKNGFFSNIFPTRPPDNLPYSCINNMAKAPKKQQYPFSAVFLSNFVECTTSDIQKTRKTAIEDSNRTPNAGIA
jgi:hypothetical protein